MVSASLQLALPNTMNDSGVIRISVPYMYDWADLVDTVKDAPSSGFDIAHTERTTLIRIFCPALFARIMPSPVHRFARGGRFPLPQFLAQHHKVVVVSGNRPFTIRLVQNQRDEWLPSKFVESGCAALFGCLCGDCAQGAAGAAASARDRRRSGRATRDRPAVEAPRRSIPVGVEAPVRVIQAAPAEKGKSKQDASSAAAQRADGFMQHVPGRRCSNLGTTCSLDVDDVLQWEVFSATWMCPECYATEVELRDEPGSDADMAESASGSSAASSTASSSSSSSSRGAPSRRGRKPVFARSSTEPCSACKAGAIPRPTKKCTLVRKYFCKAHFNSRGLAKDEVWWRENRLTELPSSLRLTAYWRNPSLM
jgi:hypothetical protein